jgi:hypothetical protein
MPRLTASPDTDAVSRSLARAAVALALAGAALAAPLAVRGADSRVPPVGGLTALPEAQAPGPNLVKNPSFETVETGAIAGWGKSVGGPWSVEANGRSGAALRMSGADAQRTATTLQQEITLQPGIYTLEGWARTQALGSKDARSGVRLCVDARPRFNWWHCTPVARGTTDWTELRREGIVIREAGPYRVAIGAYGAPDGVAWLDDIALTEKRKPPLEVFLLAPNFRGMLFSDRPQTVRVALAAAAGSRVRVRLAEEAGGEVVRERELTMREPAATTELDAAGLNGGPWLLRAELLDGDGKSTYRYPDHRIVRVSPRARDELHVWYDERNVVHLGGRPRFVLGLYTTSGYTTSRASYATGRDGWGTARMAQAPINMLINYHLGRAPIPALMAYMDELHDRGIYYLQTVNFYHRDDGQYRQIEYPAAREGEEALNRWVARTLSAHRGLAGFYTADERPADMVPKVFAQRQALASSAPGTVTYAVLGDGWERQAPLWRDAVDVLGLDPYPIVKPRGQNDLAMVGEWTRLGQEAVKSSRPVWMVIQYFPLTSAGGWPSYDDLKAMSWMAIIEGARGLVYWSYGEKGLAWVKDPKTREERWTELVRITKDIEALESVLLAPDADVARPSSPTVRALGKRMPDGARYLFAYNSTGKPATIAWTLVEPATGIVDLDAKAGVPTEKRDRFEATFAPYEVKRYLIR